MSRTVTVEAEVYLSDLDDDDLVEELESRGFVVQKIANTPIASVDAERAYYALTPDVPPAVRELVIQCAGRAA